MMMCYGEKIPGSKALAKQSYTHGRTGSSIKQYKKYSKRRNKRLLNRKVRRSRIIDSHGGKSYYKRLAGELEYQYID